VTVFSRDNLAFIAALSATGLLVAGIFAIPQIGLETDAFGGMLSIDGFASFINFLLLGAGLLSIALSHDYLKRMNLARGEYYALMLFSISGMMLMGMAADLIVVFLALELLSIPLYVLAAFARPQARSEEAGLKYFLLGAFSSGFLLYGIALVYGATGTTALSGIFTAALPHVDAGRLPGVAHSGDRLHGAGRQSGRLRCPAAHLHCGLPQHQRADRARALGPDCRHAAGRQPAGHRPE
jgi:NADH-quinone oxidoreductase subunit N